MPHCNVKYRIVPSSNDFPERLVKRNVSGGRLKVVKRPYAFPVPKSHACNDSSNTSRRSSEEATQEPPKKIVLKPASFRFCSSKHPAVLCLSSDLLSQLNDLSLERTNPVTKSNFDKVTTKPTRLNLNAHGDNNINTGIVSKRDCISRGALTCPNKVFVGLKSNGCSAVEMPSFGAIKMLHRPSATNEEHTRVAISSKEFNRWQKKKTTKLVGKPNCTNPVVAQSCSYQANSTEANLAVNELAAYIENYFALPKKMSSMAEMMYT